MPDSTTVARPNQRVESWPSGSILWIDDDELGNETIGGVLKAAGFDVDTVTSGVQGLLLAQSHEYGFIFVDLRLPDISGLDVLRALRQQSVTTPVAIVSGFATVQSAVEATKLGAVAVLEKPLLADDVMQLVLRQAGSRIASSQVGDEADPRSGAICRQVAQLLALHPELSLDETARRLSVERHSIERAIRAETGRCFREWRRALDMGRAAQILRVSDAAIKAVAYDLGYASSRAFARAFTVVMRMSPSAYRARCRSTSHSIAG